MPQKRIINGRIIARCSLELHAYLDELAKEQGVSLNHLIVEMLASSVDGFSFEDAKA